MAALYVEADALSAFAHDAEAVTTRYQGEGVRQAGLLVSLQVANNFPQLPLKGVRMTPPGG